LIGIYLVVTFLYNTFGNKDSSVSTDGMYKDSTLSASERQLEYRTRGKSPSGVIDGVYNDMYLEDGHTYNDMDRDWDADA
jgi:hypothetical protein